MSRMSALLPAMYITVLRDVGALIHQQQLISFSPKNSIVQRTNRLQLRYQHRRSERRSLQRRRYLEVSMVTGEDDHLNFWKTTAMVRSTKVSMDMQDVIVR